MHDPHICDRKSPAGYTLHNDSEFCVVDLETAETACRRLPLEVKKRRTQEIALSENFSMQMYQGRKCFPLSMDTVCD